MFDQISAVRAYGKQEIVVRMNDISGTLACTHASFPHSPKLWVELYKPMHPPKVVGTCILVTVQSNGASFLILPSIAMKPLRKKMHENLALDCINMA